MAAAIPRFHTLTVAEVRRETADAVSIAFAVPPALAADYAFAPGQYLTLRRTIDGEDMRRSYSICAGPEDGELRIAVKRVEGGPFSTWATTASRRAAGSPRSCRSCAVSWQARRIADSSCSTATAPATTCCSARRWRS